MSETVALIHDALVKEAARCNVKHVPAHKRLQSYAKAAAEAVEHGDGVRWHVTTGWFKDGGKTVLGPFATRYEALAARTGYELGTGEEGRYFVDSRL